MTITTNLYSNLLDHWASKHSFDSHHEGLIETPKRMMKAYEELLQGYHQDPTELVTVFKEDFDGMILAQGIEFFSLCEHHVLPFWGTADVAYIPKKQGKVIGLSKIPRLVHMFARRLQIQERLTQQIGNTIEELLNPLGVAVRIKAAHMCVRMRGVKTPTTMTTMKVTGVFLTNEKGSKDEFLMSVQ
jgi:GTP cyclohydrolase IA